MSIKQQGGIFGRNPTFNNVDASNVTTEGLTSETLTVDSSNPLVSFTDRVGGTPYTSSFTQSGSHLYIDNKASGAFRFRTATSIERLNIGALGDVTVNTGNLVIGTSGKGIDFSATSGTGTSELFDDYEEGNWTPAVGGVTGASYSEQVGRYTKVGDLVTCYFNIRGSWTASGNSTLTGLPFTATSTSIGGMGGGFTFQDAEVGIVPSVYVLPNSQTANLWEINNSARWALPSGSGKYLLGYFSYKV